MSYCDCCGQEIEDEEAHVPPKRRGPKSDIEKLVDATLPMLLAIKHKEISRSLSLYWDIGKMQVFAEDQEPQGDGNE